MDRLHFLGFEIKLKDLLTFGKYQRVQGLARRHLFEIELHACVAESLQLLEHHSSVKREIANFVVGHCLFSPEYEELVF